VEGKRRKIDSLPAKSETASRVDEAGRVVDEGTRDGVEGSHLTKSLGEKERRRRRKRGKKWGKWSVPLVPFHSGSETTTYDHHSTDDLQEARGKEGQYAERAIGRGGRRKRQGERTAKTHQTHDRVTEPDTERTTGSESGTGTDEKT
jgi:hypothetical protein